MLNQVQIYPIGDSISIHHLQIFQSRRIILMDHFQQLAAFQYTALGTGRETLANGAVPDFALGTMAQFNAGSMHPVQLIASIGISGALNCTFHFSAVFARKSLSSARVAILASH